MTARPRESLKLVTQSIGEDAMLPMLTPSTSAPRLIAVPHQLEVRSSDEKLQAAWDAVVRRCGTLDVTWLIGRLWRKRRARKAALGAAQEKS
jgi:hypothetical protein